MTHIRLRVIGARVSAALLTASLATACMSTSDLLTVQVPNSVDAGVFDDPSNATLMVNSVIGDFECAYGSFVMGEGIATDELHDATLNNGNWNLDRRDNGFTSGFYGVNSCATTTGVYTPMSTARAEADKAIERLTGWTTTQVPNRTTLLAQANLYAGFTYSTLRMAMCQAAFDLGPLVDQKGMFALAENRFTAAIAAAQTAGLPGVQKARTPPRRRGSRAGRTLPRSAGRAYDSSCITRRARSPTPRSFPPGSPAKQRWTRRTRGASIPSSPRSRRPARAPSSQLRAHWQRRTTRSIRARRW